MCNSRPSNILDCRSRETTASNSFSWIRGIAPSPRKCNCIAMVAVACLPWFCVVQPIAEAQPDPLDQRPARALMNNLRNQLELAETRVKAADDLYELADGLRGAASRLAYHLQRDPDPVTRQKLLRTIGMIGATATDAIPAVIKALDDPNEDVRIAAIGAVGGTAPASKAAIPRLIKSVQDENAVTRRRAIASLGRFGADAREAVPVLIGALRDLDQGDDRKKGRVSFYAIQALVAIGPDAKSAGQALIELQQTTDPDLRGPCLEALAKIVPEDARLVAILVECLNKNHHTRVRLGAARALGTLGPKAKEAVPALIAALRLPYTGDQFDDPIKSACATALGQIGPEAKAALPVLKELRSHPVISHAVRTAVERIAGSK